MRHRADDLHERLRAGAPRLAVALLFTLGAGLAAGGCGGNEPRPPEPPRVLVPELVGAEETLAGQPDYWARTLGGYLSAGELRAYRDAPPEQRFRSFGRRWLSCRLREDLLEDEPRTLTREQVQQFRSQAGYDASAALLERAVSGRGVATSGQQEGPR